ncbi:MAG: FAD-binding domain-containing protein [Polymorphobacter sp.]
MTSDAIFPPTRAAALSRLAGFAPRAGRDYAQARNSDLGPDNRQNVSQLSPYLRHRLITEREVVAAVLATHSIVAAEKFVQEVLWRTYWKGWLEMRPAVWQRYIAERDAVRTGFRGAAALARAESGMTGIEGFDDWARELVETGYLHNHARMWFASIWIFTLRLPWTLGADFFMRHLVDADPASNTLSWRWVAGLQTPGKTYLASADNIARYTGGRFAPRGLATTATALTEPPLPQASAIPELAVQTMAGRAPDVPALLLVTPEDMHPESLFGAAAAIKAAVVLADAAGGGSHAQAFVAAAAADTAARVEAHFACPVQLVATLDPGAIHAAATAAGVTRVVTAHAPVGPTADALAAVAAALEPLGLHLHRQGRSWDARFWPYARKGFFAFKETIPKILAQEQLG